MAGLPLVVLTLPFVPGFAGVALLVIALAILAVVFWRSARGLHGHVRAASYALVETLAAQTAAPVSHAHAPAPQTSTVPPVQVPDVLPGLRWTPITLGDAAPAVGRSLAELALRGATGATVLATIRGGDGQVPDAHALLKSGDVLALTGSEEAIAAATEILLGPRA